MLILEWIKSCKKEASSGYNPFTQARATGKVVGTSYFDPEHPYPLDQLLIKADEAMYEQKKNKKTSAETPMPYFSK